MFFSKANNFGESSGWMSSLIPRFVGDIDEKTSANLADPALQGNPGVKIELDKANVITSKGYTGENYLLLDIDDETTYIKESSTKGHYHIGFSTPIEDEKFDQLVTLLHEVGIIKLGNYTSYKKIGWLTLRVPWVKKGFTKALTKSGEIGNPGFNTPQEALENLQKTCDFLGVEFPNEIYQQLNAKLVAEGVDIPDSLPVDWK